MKCRSESQELSSAAKLPDCEMLALGMLDGPAMRNANRGDSRESLRANRFAEKKPIP